MGQYDDRHDRHDTSHSEIVSRINRVDRDLAILTTEVHTRLESIDHRLDNLNHSVEENRDVANRVLQAQQSSKAAFQYLGWVFGVISSLGGLALAVWAVIPDHVL